MDDNLRDVIGGLVELCRIASPWYFLLFRRKEVSIQVLKRMIRKAKSAIPQWRSQFDDCLGSMDQLNTVIISDCELIV